MPQVTGTVERVNYKDLASGRYWSFLVADEWYRTNKTKPPFEAGYKVKFDFEENQYGKQVNMDSVKFKEGEAPPKSSGGGGRNDDTQKRISFQAATNSAIAIIDMMFDKGLLELPKSKKADEKVALVTELVMNQAEELFRTYQLVPDNYDALMGGDEDEAEVDVPAEAQDAEDDEEW